jgi:3-oxoadipate enol-lactonase
MNNHHDQHETVVFLHSLGTDSGLWHDQVQALAGNYRVLVPESRGHGRIRWSGPVTVDDWVEDVHAAITAVTTAPVHLVGLSMGGIQAVAVAARHPELVRSLTVANSFATLDPAVADARIESIRVGVTDGMARYAEAYLDSTLTQPTAAQTRSRLTAAIAAVTPDAYIGSAEATFRIDNTGLLGDITCPTLILAGELDQKTPLPLSEVMRDGIAGAQLQVVAGAGHLSNIDAPAAFAQTLTRFLATVSGHDLAETH